MKFTAKQDEAQRIIGGSATHILLEGGARSGKTFLHVRNVVLRALKAPASRHLILRFRYNAVRSSIGLETLPEVMAKCYPQVKLTPHTQDGYFTLPTKSEIWLGGVDDKERTEKLLGKEYATLYFNEASQIPFASRELAITRLAQKVDQIIDGTSGPLKPRAFYDCNPPSKGHWTFKLFHQKVNPETKVALNHPADFAWFKINPEDNAANLAAGYLDTLRGLSSRQQRRFLHGEYSDENPNALFNETDIDKWRVTDGVVPAFVRIVVAVDPSGSGDVDNADNDAIGIVVVGLGVDGNAYVLEDCTVKAGPATWGKVATSAYERHQADCVIGEMNYGGEMVRHTIQTARPRTPYKAVHASRGKAVRAEPMSALYETGKVRHVGIFAKLEDELCAFSTVGYTGPGSPNRADALVWAVTELFPGLTKPEPIKAHEDEEETFVQGGGGWMR